MRMPAGVRDGGLTEHAVASGARDSCVRGHGRACLLLLGLTVVGAVLRFNKLGAQGYWGDEAYTAFVGRLQPSEILPRIAQAEGTPPVYYFAAWAWMKLFGSGEAALRSLSAICGTVTVPLAYLAAAEFVSRRAALASAALVSVSPLLVWYSQEARAYALLVLLGTLSLLFFARSLAQPTPRRLAGWAIFSALALATHYTAALLVLPEAGWILHRSRPRRPALVAITGVAAIVPPLAYLWLQQHWNDATAEFIKSIQRHVRWLQVPEQFLIGFGPHLIPVLAAFGLLIALALGFLAGPRSAPERHAAALPASLGAAVIAPLFVLSAVPSLDYLITRNVILAWLPLTIVVTAGLTARRAGRLGVLGVWALCSLSLVMVVWITKTPSLQRPNWRAVADWVGPPARKRVVVAPDLTFATALPQYYLEGARLMPRSTAAEEVIVIQVDRSFHRSAVKSSSYSGLECWWGSACAGPTGHSLPTPPLRGFALAERQVEDGFRLSRYRAARPRLVTLRGLTQELPNSYVILMETPR